MPVTKQAAKSDRLAATLPGHEADHIFKALDSRPRREILAILAGGGGKDDARCCSPDEVCACVFAERLGLSASTVSHHMKILLDAALISAEKRGLWVHYRLNADGMEYLVRELGNLGAYGKGGCR